MGICGVFDFYGNDNEEIVKTMSRELNTSKNSHKNFYSDNNIFISHLPNFRDGVEYVREKDKILFLDGILYNKEKLKNISKGDKLTLDHDIGQIVLDLYERMGNDFVKYLNGEFLILIYDAEDKKMEIFTDHISSHGLYYHYNDERFIFSSRLTSLLKHPEIELHFNYDVINWIVNFNPVDRPETLIKGVKRILSNRKLSISKKNMREEIYSSNDMRRVSNDLKKGRLGELIKKSIQKRVEAFPEDREIGIYLSGGLDSALMLSFIRKLYPERRINSYTAAVPENSKSMKEFERAEEIAEEFGSIHHKTEIPNDLEEYLEKSASYNEFLPLITNGTLPSLPSGGEIVFTGFFAESLLTDKSFRILKWINPIRKNLPRVIQRGIYSLGDKFKNEKYRIGLHKIGSESTEDCFKNSNIFGWNWKKKISKGKNLNNFDFIGSENNYLKKQRKLSFLMSSRGFYYFNKANRVKNVICFSPFADRELMKYLLSIEERKLMKLGGKSYLKRFNDLDKFDYLNLPRDLSDIHILTSNEELVSKSLKSLAGRKGMNEGNIMELLKGNIRPRIKKRNAVGLEYLIRYLEKINN